MRLTRLLIACVVLCSALSVRASCMAFIVCPYHYQECDWYGEVHYDRQGAEVCIYECPLCPNSHRLTAPGY